MTTRAAGGGPAAGPGRFTLDREGGGHEDGEAALRGLKLFDNRGSRHPGATRPLASPRVVSDRVLGRRG
jgi:hypothetical protein